MRVSSRPLKALCSAFVLATAILAVSGGAATSPAAAQDAPAVDLFDELDFRHIGPQGNRVIAVIGEPGNPDVYYAGAASGGVWRSTDGGHRWEPVFDDQDVSSIGSLALAPSDPNVLWAGTGETFIRANISLGNGIYRSTDRGDTWEHRGLDATGRIGRVVIDPRDPDVVFACALGHTYGPQPERGVYRTRDGGDSWEHVLFVDENTGCSDIVMHPANPRILFAGMWQIEVKTWGRWSGGPGSGLWMSRDGGGTWERLEGRGLPTPPLGKIGLGMSADDPDRVYALIETSSNRDFAPSDPYQGALWRSDDGGRSWEMVNASNDLSARWLYYTRLTVSPEDADEVYFNAPGHFTSHDGGRTHSRTDESPGFDHHDMWIDPFDGDRMIAGHDGGVSISTNRGRTWHRPQLPIAQMYHAHVDDRIPYYVYGNRQDGPSVRAPSNTLAGGSIAIGEWRSIGGCEVGFAVPDTVDHRTVWTGCYDGLLDVHDLETGLSRDVTVWPIGVEDWPGEDLEYRWQWTFPIEMSPHDHNTVYVGSQYVHRTTNGGQSWEVISPDLTTDDPELQRRVGGLTLDDIGPTIAPVVFAISESPLEPGVIWTGSNDGLVHVTRDGGGTWTNVTGGIPGLPPRLTVSNIQPSRHAAGKAYVAIDGHQVAEFDPYLYVTTDYGETWRRIDSTIPRSPLSYTHVIREDPTTPGLLYAGTENGIWVSFDDGGSWTSMQSNLPHAPVHWIAIQERFNDLVVATYGRGFWILDDITPIQQLAAEASPGSGTSAGPVPTPDEAVLFAPRPAYRFRNRASAMSQPDDPVAGTNPDYGATINYWLPEDTDETVEIAILDASGETVTTLGGDSDAGLHRRMWNLRGEPTTGARLRTRPDERPDFEMPESGWRSLPVGGRVSILHPPGRYTVRLTVGDVVREQPLDVLPDPASEGRESDIAAQLEIARAAYGLVDDAARLIDEIEGIREQLEGLESRLAGGKMANGEALATATADVHALLREIESELFDLRHTGDGQDNLRWRWLLYERLTTFARRLTSSDDRPTDQQVAVLEVLAGMWRDVVARFETEALPAIADLNERLREAGVPIVTGGRSAVP
ncbi:MAG: sialidase [Gemmatimonadota bacterium]|nr:sialidase [Gemmatimonadota bacterium]